MNAYQLYQADQITRTDQRKAAMNAYQRYRTDWTTRNPDIEPMTPRQYAEAMKEDRRIERETAEVIQIMKRDFPDMADYNVRDDGTDTVEILDTDDNVLTTITSEQLTGYWNAMEAAQ